MRIGHGYDVHRLVPERKLILGGVEIEHDRGLLGHSDADVLTHALMDALLGACALGDIGTHFPDKSDEFLDISSFVLLERVKELIKNKGYKLLNADITVIAQSPKLASFIMKMRENLANILEVAVDDINIKATTEEKLGFTGRKEGIAAHAVVLLEKINRE